MNTKILFFETWDQKENSSFWRGAEITRWTALHRHVMYEYTWEANFYDPLVVTQQSALSEKLFLFLSLPPTFPWSYYGSSSAIQPERCNEGLFFSYYFKGNNRSLCYSCNCESPKGPQFQNPRWYILKRIEKLSLHHI